MNINVAKTKVARANNGAWVKDIPLAGLDELALKVRGLGSTAALAATQAASDIARSEGRVATGVEITDFVIAEALALDWNLTDDAGAAIPCTGEEVRKLLADPDIGMVFRQAYAYASFAVASRGAEELEADAKN